MTATTRPVVHELADAGVVVVRGADTWSYLQSLLSQDLAPLRDGDGTRSLLLSPQGKLVADFRIARVADTEAWLDAAPGCGPVLAEGLRRFLLRVDVEIFDRSGEWGVLAVRGEGATDATATALAIALPTERHAHVPWRDARAFASPWSTLDGVDLVGPRVLLDDARHALVRSGIAAVGADAYEALRIAAGVPQQGRDVDERTIPQEAGLEHDAVSFTKGCFVGQELVCRIDSRGAQVPRHLERVRVDGTVVPPHGAVLEHEGEVVGEITSSAHHDTLGVVALAMVRRGVAVPFAGDVRWSDQCVHGIVESRAT